MVKNAISVADIVADPIIGTPLYKLSVALPAGNQMHPKKDKTNLRINCGFLLVVISNEVLIVGIAVSMCSSSDVSSRELNA